MSYTEEMEKKTNQWYIFIWFLCRVCKVQSIKPGTMCLIEDCQMKPENKRLFYRRQCTKSNYRSRKDALHRLLYGSHTSWYLQASNVQSWCPGISSVVRLAIEYQNHDLSALFLSSVTNTIKGSAFGLPTQSRHCF